MSKDIEVVEVENVGNDLPAIADETLIQIANRAEKQIEAIKKIKSIVLKVTNYNDWQDMGGKPYLSVSGAEKVARVMGISWRIDEPKMEMEPDGHFTYFYKGYFTLGGTTVECIGSRSSKDPFFRKYGKGNDAEGERIILPPSEIDKGDLRKSAFTNLLGNGITRLLGVRNLSWEEVRAGGVDTTKIGKVSYNTSDKEIPDSEKIKCPKCGGEVFDNRAKKASGKMNEKAPDAKCKDVKCGEVVWHYKPAEAVPEPAMCNSCRKVGGHDPSCPDLVPTEREPGSDDE